MTKPKNPGALTRDQAFQRAIDIISAGFNSEAVARALAKSNPVLFVQLHSESIANRVVTVAHYEIIDQIRSRNIIMAIKQVRELTGFGLKHAKDVVDSVRDALDKTGSAPTCALEPEQQVVYEQLIAASKR